MPRPVRALLIALSLLVLVPTTAAAAEPPDQRDPCSTNGRDSCDTTGVGR